MNIQVVSYYSPNYAPYAAKLKESLRRWGVLDQNVSLTSKPPFRSWHHGVSHKPTFIRQALETFSHYDGVLWLDADAYAVRRIPWEELKGADIAGCKFQWSPGHKLEILTGTMYFSTNNRVKVMVDEWVKSTARYTASDTPEQDALLDLIPKWKHTVLFQPLPIEWAFIDDEKVREQFPKAIPIFMHSQASRAIRREEAMRKK